MGVSYNSVINRDGLVLHLVAGNSRSYPGTGTTWYDLSGNNNHGTLTNGPTYSGFGGGSISFDGVDDVISLGMPASLQVGESYTLCAWVRPTANGSYPGLITTTINATFGGASYMLYFYANTRQLSMAAIGITAVSSLVVPLNTWSFVAGIRTPSGTIFYVNQSTQNGGSIASPQYYPSNNPPSRVGIGSYSVNPPSSNPFPGQMDDCRIYNRSLSALEIRQIFNSTRRRFGV